MELIYVVYHSLHLQTHIIIVCALTIVYMFVMGVGMGGRAAKRQNKSCVHRYSVVPGFQRSHSL